MVYQLNNPREASQAIEQISADAMTKNLKVTDLQWLVTTIMEALAKKLVVAMRYDTESGLDEYYGIITNAELKYDAQMLEECVITLVYENQTKQETENLVFNFNAELVEENDNSVPGNFVKYYIKKADHSTMVGMIFNYK